MNNAPTLNPVSVIRTVVPAAVAAVLGWLSTEANVVVDEESSQAVINAFNVILTTIYYIVIRFLEGRVPGFGWLLGSPNPPVYPTTAKEDIVSLAEAQRMADQAAEDAATEAYRQIDIGGSE